MTFDLIFPVITAFLGLIIGGGSVLVILARANESQPLKDSVEKLLAESISPETLNKFHELALYFARAAQFVEVVTDGEPNVIVEQPQGTISQ